MNSNHILAAAIFALSAAAYAQAAQAPDATGVQPAQQQAQLAGAEQHQHRYVTIGRDRTRVHLDRPAERSRRSAAAMGNSGPASPSPTGATPRGEDLKGGPN